MLRSPPLSLFITMSASQQQQHSSSITAATALPLHTLPSTLTFSLRRRPQAENCIHGYCARLEDLGLRDEVFLRMYVLQNNSMEQYYIVGLLVVAGQALPPQLASLSAFDGFVYHHAETNRSLVRQFVSALLMGVSPLHSLRLISGREVR